MAFETPLRREPERSGAERTNAAARTDEQWSHGRELECSYFSCCRFTISVIQTGAKGEVQFGGVG